MTKQTVALSALKLSPANVRKVQDNGIASLAADIEAHGILQNLIVTEQPKGKYAVVAGGRRYRALKQLQKAKKISAGFKVPIIIRDKAEATEISLAENVQREAMHPADAVAAYAKLRDEGHEPQAIADRYGQSVAYIRRVQRLGSLAPQIMEAFRKDEINMAAAQALALTADHERQLEAFTKVGPGEHRIRSYLTDEKVRMDDSLFLFIGRDGYEEAGGTITADLFAGEDEGYADDPALLSRLAEEKLAKIAEEYEGEDWHRVEIGMPDNQWSLARVWPEGVKTPTKAQKAKLAKLEAAYAARIEQEGEQAQWQDDEARGLRRDIEAIERGLNFYTDEQRAECAIALHVNHDGQVDRFIYRAKKEKAAGKKAATPDYSAAIVEALSRIKTTAVQTQVAGNPNLALDILLDALAGQLWSGSYSHDCPLSLRVEGFQSDPDPDLMTISDIEAVEDVHAGIIGKVQVADRYAVIRGMSEAEKGKLVGAIVGTLLNGVQRKGERGERLSRFERIASDSGVDMAARWQAPIAFYDRIPKRTQLKALSEACGDEAAENCQKMKKTALGEACADRIGGQGWLPPALRIMAFDAEGDTGNQVEEGSA